MLSVLRLRDPTPGLTALRPRLPFPKSLAGRIVLLAYVGSLALFLSFISRHVSRVPYLDEYATFRFLFGEAGSRPAEYWVQHNEHRIPLPQAVYVAVVRLSGYDFRVPVFVNAALLAFAAGYLLWVVRRVRGWFSIADAFEASVEQVDFEHNVEQTADRLVERLLLHQERGYEPGPTLRESLETLDRTIRRLLRQ